jgi:hypothetical protein
MPHVLQVLFLSVFILQVVMHLIIEAGEASN